MSEKEVREKFLELAGNLIIKASALSTEDIKGNEKLVSFALRAGEFICGLNYQSPVSD